MTHVDKALAEKNAEIKRLRAALKEAREALGTVDHPHNGLYSGLDILRGGEKIGKIIERALGDV